MELALMLLAYPESAFQKIRDGAPLKDIFPAAAAAWLSFLITVLLLSDAAVSWGGFLWIFLLGGILILCALVLKTAALHFFAKLSGGRGRPMGLFAMLGACVLPLHFLLPLTLILHRSAPVLVFLCLAGALAWMSALGFKAIKKNYHLSTAKTILVGLAPSCVFIFLCAAFGALALAVMAAKLLLLFA